MIALNHLKLVNCALSEWLALNYERLGTKLEEIEQNLNKVRLEYTREGNIIRIKEDCCVILPPLAKQQKEVFPTLLLEPTWLKNAQRNIAVQNKFSPLYERLPDPLQVILEELDSLPSTSTTTSVPKRKHSEFIQQQVAKKVRMSPKIIGLVKCKLESEIAYKKLNLNFLKNFEEVRDRLTGMFGLNEFRIFYNDADCDQIELNEKEDDFTDFYKSACKITVRPINIIKPEIKNLLC